MRASTSLNYAAGRREKIPALIWCGNLSASFGTDAAAWSPWKDKAKSSLLANFPKHLCLDEAALIAALQQPWSNGPVERHVHPLKADQALHVWPRQIRSATTSRRECRMNLLSAVERLKTSATIDC
jgi:hypothetical protein